jgi:restriction endonuclease Mrr
MAEVDPPKDTQEAKWKRFEKLVYEIQKSFAGTNATVTHKDYIMGQTSNVDREIDISIKQKVAQFSILVIIDCKDYATPVDVTTVGEFASVCEDVRANKGVIISSNGFTPAAITFAKNKGIDTLSLIDSKGVDWKTYISVPLLIESTSIDQYALSI